MNINDLLHELNSTRLKRLQRTQFVYWPERSAQPRIEHANGTHSYLRETPVMYRVRPDADLLEYLKQLEQSLFDTPDEAVVYWRGWNISDKPRVVHAEYCMAYLWNNDVHTEARSPTTGLSPLSFPFL